MSSKYAFSKGLREVRFLFCQSSEHSAAVRYALSPSRLLKRLAKSHGSEMGSDSKPVMTAFAERRHSTADILGF
jgi:hypothetical protein